MIDTGSGIIEVFHNGEITPKGTIRHFNHPQCYKQLYSTILFYYHQV